MKKKIEYKWIVVALCFAMVFTTLGFCSSNKALYLSAITETLQLPRSAFALGDSIRFISTAVVNMFFGTLVRKFGTKKLIGAGFCSLICFTVLYATSNNLWGFYIGGAFLGIGLSWTTTTMVGWVVGKWCKENKGTIMGAVLAANGIGGAVAPPEHFMGRQIFLLLVKVKIDVDRAVVFRKDPALIIAVPGDEDNVSGLHLHGTVLKFIKGRTLQNTDHQILLTADDQLSLPLFFIGVIALNHRKDLLDRPFPVCNAEVFAHFFSNFRIYLKVNGQTAPANSTNTK